MNLQQRTPQNAESSKFTKIIKKIFFTILNEWLLIAICLTILAAYLFPDFGSDQGPLNPNFTENLLVGIVFFGSGLGLKFHQLKEGIFSWPSHLIIQIFVFAVFPCYVYGFVGLFFHYIPDNLFPFKIATGIIIMDTLPTTITMAPIFTQASKGSLTVALLNASLSSLLSIFICPLLVYLQLGSQIQIDYASLLLKLAEIVVIPIVGGLLLQFLMSLTTITTKIKNFITKYWGIVNKICLLFLTYLIFCGSFSEKETMHYFSPAVLGVMTGMLTFFHVLQLLLLFGLQVLIRQLGVKFDRPTIVAQIIVASQKTMTMGIPLIKALFPNDPVQIGLVTLPIIIYHSIETVSAGILVSPFSKWVDAEQDPEPVEQNLLV